MLALLLTVCFCGFVVQLGGRSLQEDDTRLRWYARQRVVHRTWTTEMLEGRTTGAEGGLDSCKVCIPSRVASSVTMTSETITRH